MQALLSPLEDLVEFGEAKEALRKGKTPISLCGCVDSQKLHMIYGLSQAYRMKVIVTYNELRAKEIMEEYRFYDRNVMFYPAKDLIFFQADIHGNQLTKERICTLRRIAEHKPTTIVTTFVALMSPQAKWDAEDDVISLEKGESINLTSLSKKLVNLGYEKTYQVEAPGQFSCRGGIIDIYDLTQENPYRIELWGDDVDSIRSFDVLSQRSVENLEHIMIYPAAEFVLTEDRIREGIAKIEKEAKKRETYFRENRQPEEATRIKKQVAELKEQLVEFQSLVNVDSYIKYFYEDTVSLVDLIAQMSMEKRGEAPLFFLDEPIHIFEHADAVETEFRESMGQRALKGYILPTQMDLLYGKEQILAQLCKLPLIYLTTMEMGSGMAKAETKLSVTARSISSYNNSFEALIKDLAKYKKQGYRVVLLSGSRTRAKRLAMDLQEQEIPAVYSEDPFREAIPGEVLTAYGYVRKGFEYPMIQFVVIAESDIFGLEKKKKRKKLYQGQKIADFNELKVGDYVIHESHGLGEYQGIEKVTVDHVTKDYMKIRYRDGGNLYVLATELNAIGKYSGADGAHPKLNKLGGKEWEKTKTKVRTAVEVVAQELVSLYAARQMAEGYQYGKDTVWQREFEEMFPFEETEDQLNAIVDTKMDMESTKTMDRLICGDVGYGKTEIAIRAAFKAVQENKQVVYLVPTTILAQQHFNTFTQRMKDFPVRIDLLSRFRTQAEIKKTLLDLKKGMVDIVIGTHRVLSKDVEFKDLGLLIIDEEQRFGVAHKEKIKQMKENVDVLTLTATPIPRTLHMSLVGIRDMSVLEEAPEERMPIQTFVCAYDEELVREAIVRELARNGQVYYVYNVVNNIADIAARIAELVPEATVAYAHGQMREQELEKIMIDFVSGEIDVLVSTTIIETGLDISNVNTMIIHDSDRLGLSQLYQLRGRVGRSNRTAYAFLMYKKDKILKEVAEKRLAAIREFTDLGSGFKIAMRDLEIRGAGNLLGMHQHGHMEAVGYDLYCKMLNDAVMVQKGISKPEEFNTSINLDVDAFIPAQYIMNESQKLDIYKRIAVIENEKEKEDMIDELTDRFGTVPVSADNLLRIALIRVKAHELYVEEITGKNERIILTFSPKAQINPAGIPDLIKQYGDRLKFTAYGTPYFTLRYYKTGMVEKDSQVVLEETEKLLANMSILKDVKCE